MTVTQIVIFNAVDPCIGITLIEGEEGKPPGFRGACTECGHVVHRWARDKAVADAQRHVDAHEPVLIGGDTDALVR